jgi:hypothetical protein
MKRKWLSLLSLVLLFCLYHRLLEPRRPRTTSKPNEPETSSPQDSGGNGEKRSESSAASVPDT